MGRIFGSVVAGYLTMFVAVFVLFTAAYLLLGANGAFQPASWDPSTLWIAASIVVGLAGAVLGGFVCAAIAKNPRGPQALIGVVIVLGLIFAIPVLSESATEVASAARPESITMFEAMQNANQPGWIALLNPLLGAVGVLIGARLHRSRQSEAEASRL